MSYDTARIVAHQNALEYNKEVKAVKDVAGRTYLTDKTEVTGDRELQYGRQRAIGRTSAALVYKMEYYLIHGFRFQGKNIPNAERDRVIEEYGLEYNDDLMRYFKTEEDIFKELSEKYPEAIAREHIGDYLELSYRATHRR